MKKQILEYLQDNGPTSLGNLSHAMIEKGYDEELVSGLLLNLENTHLISSGDAGIKYFITASGTAVLLQLQQEAKLQRTNTIRFWVSLGVGIVAAVAAILSVIVSFLC